MTNTKHLSQTVEMYARFTKIVPIYFENYIRVGDHDQEITFNNWATLLVNKLKKVHSVLPPLETQN